MTRAELRAAARELVERSTRRQGLPYHVEHPEAIAKTIAWLRAGELTPAAEVEKGGDADARAS